MYRTDQFCKRYPDLLTTNPHETLQLIDQIDAILKIEIERIRSEKEMVAMFREQHLDIIKTTRSAIFTSVGVVATAMAAVAGFKYSVRMHYCS